ncbi:MAG TPA: DEAD/DEAH box helicase [Propionibacteriaceae bacterium]|nr:DEAD/DEAH box helicase [Propionibacteriaceae bacterium]
MTSSTSFTLLGVPANLAQLLADQGITDPTPIQTATLPDSLAGRDVLGRGRTGSGKTYAFLLPVVARLTASQQTVKRGAPRALILAPTRELVGQIHAALMPLARANSLSTMTVFGGVGQNPQVAALRKGADIVVATPGRLEDLIKQGHARLADIEVTVLDEADHMADLGFLPAVKRILDLTPQTGQRMLFSATLDKAIDGIVARYLHNARTHQADSAQSPVSTMHHHVLHVDRGNRVSVLVELTSAPGRTLVFTRTKHGAKQLARQLNAEGVPAVDLHGNLSQNARTRNLDAFHTGKVETLVATDIAARGIHVDDVGLVVHADPPVEEKAYLHRSGRTARAGNEGTVITLMTDDQVRDVRALTRAAGINPTITRIDRQRHPMLATLAPGERVLVPGGYADATPVVEQGPGRGRSAGGRSRHGSGGGGRGPSKTHSSAFDTDSGLPRGGSGRGTSGGTPGKSSGARGSAAGSRGGSNGARGGAPRKASDVRKVGPSGNAVRPHSAASFSARRSG